MFLLDFRRKLTALALCKSIESAIQWFQIHHKITFATMQNPAVYLSGARVSIFSTLVPRLICLTCKLALLYNYALIHSDLLYQYFNERAIYGFAPIVCGDSVNGPCFVTYLVLCVRLVLQSF